MRLKPRDLNDLNWQSVWNEKKSESWSFFCPLCSTPRKVAGAPRLNWKHALQIGLTGAVFTLATWNWFQWRGLVSIVPLWVGFELTFRTRLRAQLLCTHCGFDPFLFVTDENLAKNQIENHWRKIFAEKGIPYPDPGAAQADRKEGSKLDKKHP
jgi:hypothetical protein